MHYFLIERDFPEKKLRHYKNSRVAKYTVAQLNERAGFEKYAYIVSDGFESVDYVGENPVDAKVKYLAEKNEG